MMSASARTLEAGESFNLLKTRTVTAVDAASRLAMLDYERRSYTQDDY